MAGGQVGDFEFRCQVRFQGNNSGVQYRSRLVDAENFVVAGYQADLHPAQQNFGMLYGEKYGDRGIIASRGQRLRIAADGSRQALEELPLGDALVGEQWNELRIIAAGERLVHQVNGTTTVDVIDQHPLATRQGILALQLHAGPPMKVEFRNLLLRQLDTAQARLLLADVERQATPSEPAAPDPQTLRLQWLTREPQPQWVWTEATSNEQRLLLRKSFELPDAAIESAKLYTTCDNRLKLWINGQAVGESPDWPNPIEQDVAGLLRSGTNVIAAECRNAGGTAAFVFKLTSDSATGQATTVISDSSWKHAAEASSNWQQPDFDDSSWTSGGLRVRGELGVDPWKIPNYNGSGSSAASDPLHPKNILTRPGFVIDRLYRVPKTQGSWVCLTTDGGDGFFVSDQGDQGLFHVRPSTTGLSVEPLTIVDADNGRLLSGAQGLLWAFDSLWVHRNGGHLYRVTDSNQDGQLDTAERYPSQTGGGEHGNHALILTEDQQGIYMAGGNHAPLADCQSQRVPSWDEDQLLPRMWDANGHARGVLAPGGWVTRLNPQTQQQELICIGFRNEYDIALNRFGDMFTFDADMEWDMGMPWYRPTRICQVVSGGDYGWRSGSDKWPTYYEDSLPPVVDIGPGSPTGVVCGTHADFPTAYQAALFALDWTFGTIYAVHLKPEGAGYLGDKEPFIYGTPLPVTDATIGADGHFYFTVGGRGTDSALFRARYVGDESRAAPDAMPAEASQARETRRLLESFHGRLTADAVDTAWPHLSSSDRFIRNAARVAIEFQPVDQWAGRLATADDPQTKITASVALARSGSPTHQPLLLRSLLSLTPAQLPESQLLGLLRGYALAFIRLGKPSDELRQAVLDELSPLLPHSSANVNQELLSLLIYLQASDVIERGLQLINAGSPPTIPDWEEVAKRNPGYGGTIERMRNNPPPSREIGLAFALRNVSQGWTQSQLRQYFEFLNRAAKGSGGASYPGFLRNMREEVLQNCSNEDRLAVRDVTGEDFNPVPDFDIAPIAGPGQKWDLEQALRATNGKPDFVRGRSLFFAADCGKCHRLSGLGGSVGPDLTSIPNKFDTRYVVEAIINPSQDISDQYSSSNVLLDDGRLLTGLVMEDGEHLEIYPVQATDQPIRVLKAEVEARQPAKISQMPEGLLDRLSADEIRDLMAYLMSGGNPDDRRYQR